MVVRCAVLVVPLTCPTCGAAGRHLDGSLFALCAYCGAVIARHADAVEGAIQAVRRAYVGFISPSDRDARLGEVGAALIAARDAGDREAFRAATVEQILLEIADAPARVPGNVGRSGLAAWVRQRAAVHEVAMFDPKPSPQLDAVALEADPEVTARAHLTACVAYGQRILDDAAFPVELRGELAAETIALDLYRVSLAALAPMVSADALDAAIGIIGGDGIDGQRTCATCAGPYEAHEAAMGACPWCRSAIDTLGEHPWVSGLVRVASAVLAIQRAPRERASAVLQIAMSNVILSGKLPRMPLVHAYLRRTIPDTEPSVLGAVLALLHQTGGELAQKFLAELDVALADWRATVAAPRTPDHQAPPGPTTIETAWEDPWVRTQLVTWTQTKPGREPGMAALAFVLLPIAMGGAITAAQGAAFVLRAGVAPAEAIELCAQRRKGATPVEAALLDEVARLIGLAPAPSVG
jgi:hypothetical protein